jgi:Uncharacterized protein conserved in bacteria (DUF2313).
VAEVLAGAIAVSSSANAQSSVALIVKSGGAPGATAALNANSIRVYYGGSNSGATSALNANSIRVYYGGGASTGVSAISAIPIRQRYAGFGDQSVTAVQVSGHKYKTTGASLSVSSTLEAYQTDLDIDIYIHDYLPRFYGDFRQVVEMLKTEASEFTRLRALLLDVLNQFYVETATYGLDRWEKITDIEYLPQRSIPSRRHYINAKLRGVGTVTPALLKSIVDAFYTAEIYEEPSEYKVRIKLIGKRGVPKNLEDIEAVVNDVIPAHLQPYFEFTYLPWSEVEAAGLTWEQAEQYTAEDLEEAFLLPQN